MRGRERLSSLERSTPVMHGALPAVPMAETVMVRLIRTCVMGMGNYFEPVFRDMAMNEYSFHVLCLLLASDHGAASPSELSDLVGTSRANMTRILDQLIEDGHVSRATAARDARRSVIRITPTGRSAALQAAPKMIEPLERAFSSLSKDEFAALDRLLRKVIVNFDQQAAPLRVAA